MTERGSRLFLAVSAVPRMTPVSSPGRLVYRLERASVPIRNNRRALETAAFATPISRAYLLPRRGSVDLVIELRAGATTQPTPSQQPGPDGVSFVMLEFPPYQVSLEEPTRGGATEPQRASTRPDSNASIRPSQPSQGETQAGARVTGQDDERPPPVVR
jgi:hypothetical protein